MAEETRLADQRAEGARAKELLEDPLIKRFFDNAEKVLLNTFRESDVNDREGHTQVRIALRMQENLRGEFIRCIVNGDVSAKKLLQLKEPSKLRRMINNG